MPSPHRCSTPGPIYFASLRTKFSHVIHKLLYKLGTLLSKRETTFPPRPMHVLMFLRIEVLMYNIPKGASNDFGFLRKYCDVPDSFTPS